MYQPELITNLTSEVVKLETVNTGGGCLVDLITLSNGMVLGVNEECVCLYPNEAAFWACEDAPCIDILKYAKEWGIN